jgi:outer membrane receptor protein involved in Fe transport
MVYARFASGYRPGTPNLPAFGVARESDPDRTKTYELGLKGEFLEHLLSTDASLYYIDWTNIQIQLTDPVSHLVYNTNGSAAKSEGVELSATARPATGLSISAWAAYDNAVLTQSLPANSPTAGNNGDRLPLSSRYSGNVSLNQDFPLPGDMRGFVGAAVSYVGDRIGVLGAKAAPQRQVFPAYTKADLRAGVRFESWVVNAYVNNVADRRALTDGGIGYLYPPARIYITPRTVGLTVIKNF